MENSNTDNKKKFTKKLLHKYRLIILNEDTFEERVSFRLTRLNVFVACTLAAILLVAGTTLLIAFTGLREYIPGYSSTALRQQAADLAHKTDSLQAVVALNNQYYNSIRKVLAGDVSSVDFNRDSLLAAQEFRSEEEVDLRPSKEDSILRQEVVREDKYNIFETAISKVNYALFAPVKGLITEGYNLEDRHYGVDVVVAKNAPIKSVSEGTVIFAEWTAETGNVIIVEHSDLLSVYKHNSSLVKKQGEQVRKGEVIATGGSTGELSTGPHLHFELWSEGQPVNPTDFIDFE